MIIYVVLKVQVTFVEGIILKEKRHEKIFPVFSTVFVKKPTSDIKIKSSKVVLGMSLLV